MNRKNVYFALVMLLGVWSELLSQSVSAQLLPDNSLGAESSVVTPQNVRDLIEGGAIRQENLFHSFREFNVGNSQQIYFANPAGVENIFTRITGSNVSNIFGTLGVDGAANLFLLNPNGILFGENAQLDLNGSFFASTGDSLVFENGFAFSATTPNSPPLLTVNVPLGIQYGSNGLGDINNAAALAVISGQSLVFNGNEIHNTGTLTAPEGQVELLGNEVTLGDGTGIEANLIRVQAENNITIANQSNDQLLLTGNGGFVEMLAGGNVAMEDITSDTIKTNGQNITISGANLILGNIDTSQFAVSGGDILATVNVDTSGAIPEEGTSGTAIFTFTVPELADSISNLDVIFSASHTYVSDLDVVLTSPAGTAFLLLSDVGGSGDDFQDTLLDDSAETNITSGNAPFNGTFQPMGEGGLAVFNGENPTGIWQLEVIDFFEGDSGQLYQAGETAPWGEAIGTQLIFRTPTIVESGASGSITLNATSGNVNTGNLNSSNLSDASGFITINASNGEIQVRELNTSNRLGNGGHVNLVADGNIITESVNTSSSVSNAGDIILTSHNGAIDTTAGILGASILSFEGENGGAIALSAKGDINMWRARTDGGFFGGSGDIRLTSEGTVSINDGFLFSPTFGSSQGGNIEINTQSFAINNTLLDASTYGQGDSGKIAINANDLVSIEASAIRSLVDSVGNSGGIEINARSLSITDLSELNTSVTPNGQGEAGNIALNTEETITLDGGFIRSRLEKGGVGSAGDIIINTGSLTLTGIPTEIADAVVGQVVNATFGEGNAGDVIINAREQVILDGRGSDIWSLVAFDYGIGNGGNILIESPRISVINEARLVSSTEAEGLAGNITLRGDTVSISNGASVKASSQSPFDAGSLTIEANTFEMVNGGALIADTISDGNAGNITLGSPEQRIANIRLTGEGSGLFANTSARGNGGNITIYGESLSLTDDAQLLASTEENSFGRGGNITLNLHNTFINQGASIAVDSQGSGEGGSITLQGDSLTLNNQALLTAATASNQGGDISVQLNDLLLMRNNSQITATAGTAGAGGDGGNIDINAKFIIAFPNENSDITANAFEGKGGNISLTAESIFGLQFREAQTPLSDITASSEFGLAGTVEITTPDVDPSQGLVELPEEVVDPTTLVASSCSGDGGRIAQQQSEFIITGRGGLPSNPNETLIYSNVLADWVTVDNNVTSANREKVKVTLREQEDAAIIEAQGWVTREDGKIFLTATPTKVNPQETGQMLSCQASQL